MGKPNDHDAAAPSTRPPPFTEPSSSISLHTQQDDYQSHHQQTDRYFDDDPAELQGDDLPPLYTDHVDDQPVTGSGPGTGGLVNPLLPAGVSGPKLRPFRRETATGREFYLDRRLDTDAVFLEEHIRALLDKVLPREEELKAQQAVELMQRRRAATSCGVKA